MAANKTANESLRLPIIDLSGWINPQKEGDRERVVEEVKAACAKYGFFQTTGHGIPVDLQKGLLNSINTLFDMPQEEKLKLSFLENISRRGYEKSGMSLRDGDKLPDSKEVREETRPQFLYIRFPRCLPSLSNFPLQYAYRNIITHPVAAERSLLPGNAPTSG